ncbi:SsrA-binding protein SmpB [Synechococcus sp. O70.2]|jgi:SsrA-binding protein|uniref:SsrA-binding protein SmpB n=1 Tax=unclassified Synechococcus TaxID=2626047 RepID=UPI0039C14AD3
MAVDPNVKTLVENRRARFEYEILETYEAGLQLTGTEVKSIRAGKANLQDAFALFRDGEAWLHNLHVAPHGTTSKEFNHDPTRRRKLLLHRREIDRLRGLVEQKGLTVVPLRLVLNRGWIKAHLGVARGKKLHDKRQAIKERETRREIQRELKGR